MWSIHCMCMCNNQKVSIFLLLILEFYNDSFFESLDGVCNALDNVDASMLSHTNYLQS